MALASTRVHTHTCTRLGSGSHRGFARHHSRQNALPTYLPPGRAAKRKKTKIGYLLQGPLGRSQAAAQAAQAAALGRYRLVNAWFYPRGDWYTFYWDGSSADKVARRATYPTLEHDDHDPGPLAERIRRDKREFSIFGAERIRRDKREFSGRSSDDSSSDRDSCGTGSTSEANDIFDTLEDHLGYGSDSGSGW